MDENTNNTSVTTTEQNANKTALVTDYKLGIFGTSDNFLMATQMAKALSSSTIVPKEYQNNFANSIVAIEIAQRVKTSPLMVMQNLNVIQGRPSWSAQFLIAMVNGSGKFDMELQFAEEEKDGKPYSCYAWTVRKGRTVKGIKVTMDMAKAEGWVDRNGSKWKTMPQVMLRYRAASFFARMECPELTLGYFTQDEVIDGDFKEISPLEQSVKDDVAQNANSVDFPEPTPVAEEKKPVKEKAKKQPTEAPVINPDEYDVPDFMKG